MCVLAVSYDFIFFLHLRVKKKYSKYTNFEPCLSTSDLPLPKPTWTSTPIHAPKPSFNLTKNPPMPSVNLTKNALLPNFNLTKRKLVSDDEMFDVLSKNEP